MESVVDNQIGFLGTRIIPDRLRMYLLLKCEFNVQTLITLVWNRVWTFNFKYVFSDYPTPVGNCLLSFKAVYNFASKNWIFFNRIEYTFFNQRNNNASLIIFKLVSLLRQWSAAYLRNTYEVWTCITI